MLNLSKIEYGHEITREAEAMRQHQAHGGKNIATICLTNGLKFTRSSIPAGPPGVSPKHSEAAAWEALNASGALAGNMRISWVYTERYPCGHNPGMRNCYGLLEGILKSHGAAGLDTPVYFTYEYPDDSHMWFTMLLCQLGYEMYESKPVDERHVILASAPKLIEIGKYMSENNLNAKANDDANSNAAIMEIARDLYSNYRDEAISQLVQRDK